MSTPRQEQPRSLRLVILVLAFACGASVANLYYAQPLLVLIAHSFGVSQGTATTVVTLTQVGYAVGLVLLLPLGDLLENRRLTSGVLLVTAVALLLAALAPDFGVFLVASALIGLTSVVAQVLVPLAAHLAPEESRGRFVGQVMSGLLLGIMLARSVSSFVAAAWGWRSIFVVSAVLMVLTSLLLARLLPLRVPETHHRYRDLLGSVVAIARSEPVLRRRALAHALMFGSFTAFWTAVVYELIDEHGFSQAQVAVFALVGAAGAAAAPIAGRLGDRGVGTTSRLGALVLGVVSLVLAGLGASSVVLLAVAGVLLDLAVQSHQVLSQRDIYALRPDARARVNSVYMTSVFVGGAISSALTGLILDTWGWSGVTVFAAILPALGVLVWLQDGRSAARHDLSVQTT